MSTSLTSAYAIIDDDRQAYCINVKGERSSLSTPTGLMWANWRANNRSSIAYSWPTWNNSGDKLALFRLNKSRNRAITQVITTDPSGVCTTELLTLENRLPIYLFWNETDTAIGTLTQRTDSLVLSVGFPERLGDETRIISGSPLFFTWVGAQRLAVFVGNRDHQSRMVIFSPLQEEMIKPLPGVPNHFCTPLWVGERLYYVIEKGQGGVLVSVNPETMEARHLIDTDGLVALVASPNQKSIAYSISHRGSNGPYNGIFVLDIETGESRQIDNTPCLAFLWVPTGKSMIVARYHHEKHMILLEHLSLSGESIPLTDLHPTRDTGFYLRFFEQLAVSHPIISPCGEYMLIAGGTSLHPDLPSSTIWRVPLSGEEPVAVDSGVLAVMAPNTKPV